MKWGWRMGIRGNRIPFLQGNRNPPCKEEQMGCVAKWGMPKSRFLTRGLRGWAPFGMLCRFDELKALSPSKDGELVGAADIGIPHPRCSRNPQLPSSNDLQVSGNRISFRSRSSFPQNLSARQGAGIRTLHPIWRPIRTCNTNSCQFGPAKTKVWRRRPDGPFKIKTKVFPQT